MKNILNPWVQLWIKPRVCLQQQLEQRRDKFFLFIAVMSGLVIGASSLFLSYVMANRGGQSVAFSQFLQFRTLLPVVLSWIVFSILCVYLMSWVYLFLGKKLKGQGDLQRVRTAFGWSLYPSSLVSSFWILISTMQPSLLKTSLVGIYIVIAIWSSVVFLKLLSEAHRFSIWRALAVLGIVALTASSFAFGIGWLIQTKLTL